MKRVPIELGNSLPVISESFVLQMNFIMNASKNNFLLIFDEIENISPKTAASEHWKNGNDTIYFWQIIRSFLQSESKGRISICIVGTSPRILEVPQINEIANPVYLYAQKRFIPNFDFDDTREMVERLGFFMGLDFSAEVIADLQKEFGGHPFFIRQVCSKIHQFASASRPIRVSIGALQRAKSEFSGQLESYLRDIIDQLRAAYPGEYKVLSALLAGEKSEVNEYGKEAPDLIDHLIGYGLIDKVGADFDIKFEAIRSALSHVVLANADNDDRWIELSRRRNRLESELRVALYHWCRGIDTQEWKDIVEKNITKKDKNSCHRLSQAHSFPEEIAPSIFPIF